MIARLLGGHVSALAEMGRLLHRQRHLTIEMARQDLFGRFAGQILGGLWAVAHPLFLMALYLFVFAVVFKQKVGGTMEMPRDFATYLLAGLIPWLAVQETMSKATTAIIAHSNLVKQVVFPTEVLPAKAVVSALFTQGVALALLVIYSALRQGALPWTYALIPVLLVVQLLLMVGIAYLLAALGTYLRDLKDLIQLFAVAGPFLLPAFYLPSQIPETFRMFLYFNPFSYMVWAFQDVFYFGRIEHPLAWVVFVTTAILAASVGYRLFRKLKTMFGNVL